MSESDTTIHSVREDLHGTEAMIRADMESVGIYSPIFDSTIKQLAKLERELPKAEKTWQSRRGKNGGRARQ